VFALFLLLTCLCSARGAEHFDIDSLSSGPRQQSSPGETLLIRIQCSCFNAMSFFRQSVVRQQFCPPVSAGKRTTLSRVNGLIEYAPNPSILPFWYGSRGKQGPVSRFRVPTGIQPGTFSLHVANVVLSNPENTNVVIKHTTVNTSSWHHPSGQTPTPLTLGTLRWDSRPVSTPYQQFRKSSAFLPKFSD